MGEGPQRARANGRRIHRLFGRIDERRVRRLSSAADASWWHGAVFYQIYPRSWVDSNRDGVGDLRGIISRLAYLEWLGVDGIWLNPTMPSPNRDWGYDVADYRGVHPELGTMEDLEDLLEQAQLRDIRIVLDLVPNHTSDEHPWFQDACRSRTADHREWYVWADPAPDGGPPNNWLSVFAGEPAWEWHAPTRQYYLHNFLKGQPDLNWWSQEVRAEFEAIVRFWFDKGVSGFRIDVAHALVNDRELRDNPAATDMDHEQVRRIGQSQVYNMNRPEVHDILQSWRRIADTYDPERLLVGETYVYEYTDLAPFYGSGVDELHLAFNIPFIFSDFSAAALAAGVEETLGVLPGHAWPVWTGSNHDAGRFPTRWCQGREDLTRCALMMLLTLPGPCFLYYGDEIGMTDVPLRYEDLRDPVGKRRWPEAGRDPMRTPMQWSAAGGAGFTVPGTSPWLPLGDHEETNVEAQRRDPDSMLHLVRELIELRKRNPDLRGAGYERVSTPPDVWAWRRGSSTVVALNLGESAVSLDTVSGEVLLATDARNRRGAAVQALRLEARQGAVLGPAREVT